MLAAAAQRGGLQSSDVLLFVLAGTIAPGVSQIMFFRAVRDAGAARAAVLVGTAPLIAGVIAVAWLGEPVRAGLVVGTVLIVSGGFALAGERIRPQHFRAVGAVLAVTAAVLFATRDNVVRRLAVDTEVVSLVAASATLAGGGGALLAYVAITGGRRLAAGRSSISAWLPAGVLFGLSYVALFEAYYRGRVTVVSPIVATESLWGVLFSAVFLRSSELVGVRLVAGAILIVAGGALIGATR